MNAIVSTFEGPLALFTLSGGETLVLPPENTLEAKRQADRAWAAAEATGALAEDIEGATNLISTALQPGASVSTLTETTEKRFASSAELEKLATVQDRSNHTGYQPISSVAGLQPRVLPAGNFRFELIPAGAGTGFAWGLRGALDNSFFGLITTDGILAPDAFRAPAASVGVAALTAAAQSRLVRAGFNLSELPSGTGYSWGLRGADNSFFGLIDANGYFSPERMLLPAGSVANASLTPAVSSRMAPVGMTLGPLPPGTGYLWGLRGTDGSFLGLVTTSGSFSPDGFTLPNGTVSKPKLAADVLGALVPSVTSFRALPAGMGIAGAAVGTDGSVLYTIDGTGKFDMKVSYADAADSAKVSGGVTQSSTEGLFYNVWVNQADLGNRQIMAQRLTDGAIFAVTSSGDNYQPRLDRSGKRVIFTTTGVGERVAQLDRDTGRGLVYPVMPTSTITGIGDSYTGPASLWTPYLDLMKNDPRPEISGRTYVNRGYGGDRGEHIEFRMGSVQAFVNVAGGQIPASGSVAVTLVGASFRAAALPVTIRVPGGDVSGTLATADLGVTVTFTRTTNGAAIVVPDGTEIVCDYADAARSTIRIIEFGINDTAAPVKTPAQKIANLVRLMDDQRTIGKKTIVMGHWDAQWFNAQAIADIPVFNAMAKAECEKRGMSFIDIRGHIMANVFQIMAENGLTPTAADLSDIARGVIPGILRPQGDNTHLITALYQIVATKLGDLIIAKGY